MQPRVYYVKSSDGVHIAVFTLGEGRALVIARPCAAISLEGLWEIPEIRRNYERLGLSRKLIVYDSRGVGLSSREVENLSLPAQEQDLEAVVASLDSPVDLLAMAQAGPYAISFAAHHPRRVRRLVLLTTAARGRDIQGPSEFQSLTRLIEENWELYLRTIAAVTHGWNEVARRWAERQASDMTKEVYLKGMVDSFNSDVTELLPSLQCPTLVMHWRERWTPIEVSRGMSAAIPNARLITFSQEGGAPQSGDWESVFAPAVAFLDEGSEAPGVARYELLQEPVGTSTILFADIVDSTALTERLGDAAFRAKARELDGALRSVIRERAGTPIEGKLLGDGVLAAFFSARRAIEAALACGRAGDDAGLPLHLGLHAGDVIREEGNVYGGAVNIAARISALSGPGEVLVSQTVRDLARTSAGVTFEDRGEQSLKGVGEPVRVWAVREGEPS